MATRKSPYSNLLGEMAKANVSREDIAKALGKTYQTIHSKIVGDTDFTLKEMVKIQRLLDTDLTLDVLFKF